MLIVAIILLTFSKSLGPPEKASAQGSSIPRCKTADHLLGPVIVQEITPLRSKNNPYTLEILRGTSSFFLTATA